MPRPHPPRPNDSSPRLESGTMPASKSAEAHPGMRAPFELAISEQLVRADRLAALGTLAGGVAHEINNPLTYVLVNVEHVIRQLRAHAAGGEPLSPEEIDAYVAPLAQALDGANRVRAIVRDLMTFSRGHVDKKAMVDVRRVIEASLMMTAHELRHRARVERRLRDVPPVVANEARLGQVFLNILVNAARAIPEGDVASNVVSVESEVDDEGHVVVKVRDTGEGIAPENLAHVFDPFFTTHEGESTGLGLSIAHGIVASFGGTLTATSEIGRGTEMRVTLPIAPGYDASSSGQTPVTPTPVRRRVLVIDEDPRVAEAIAKSLSDEHDVDVTTDAYDALDRFVRGVRYDVVLCDLMMPNMTGMDLYREVLRVAPHVASRIVFLSGGVYTARARAFVESLPNRCLEKPPDLAKLRELSGGEARSVSSSLLPRGARAPRRFSASVCFPAAAARSRANMRFSVRRSMPRTSAARVLFPPVRESTRSM